MSDNKVVVTPVWVLNHHRVYERYIFFYIVIMYIWLFFASYTFTHYKIDGWSPQQNFALGFAYYLFFAGMIALTPAIYRLTLLRFTETDKYQQRVLDELEQTATQEEYDAVYDYLQQNGEFPPNRGQTLAAMGIFWILIFELYLLYDGMEDLVWQPEWLQAFAQWVIDHTNQDEILRFTFDPPGSVRSETWYAEMRAILETPEGRSMAAFHGWVLFSYPILIACMGKLLWHALDWLGFDNVNPRNIRSFGRFIWLSFLSIFMLIFLIVPTYYLVYIDEGTLKKVSASESGIAFWLADLKLSVMFALFSIFGLKYFLGWFQFWRRVFFKLFKF